MKSHVPASPLYPYLHSTQNRFFLNISLSTGDPTALEKTPFPFSVIVDSDPLTRLIEGTFLSDGGSEIKRVFLLVQRDQYLLNRDELWPIYNPLVDTCWQRAFSFHADGKHGRSQILISNQVSEQGRLVPFQSLFFCKTRKLFFAPPCPSCGAPLELCCDESLLTQAGLQPYSTSLKRYLFCSPCTPQDISHFFVYELDASDPPTLKDRRTLIQEFGQLGEKGSQTGQFPCITCSSHQECYGSGNRALSRIVPFAFYPFHMFIFEALSLNAVDFLSLLSGAAFGELEDHLKRKGESGRIKCLKAINPNGLTRAPSLFPEGDRYFLEILFLKLSFLGELIQSFLEEREISKHPDIRLSLDRVWVKFDEPSGLLPFSWNFKVKFIDLGLNPGRSVPRSAGWESLYSLGLVWFYTLLVNRSQDMSKVYLSFEEWLNHFAPQGEFSLGKFWQNHSDPVFHPENIFWNQEGKKVDQHWHSLWEEALHLGGQLLEAGRLGASPWAKENFLKQMDTLMGEVKRHLLAPQPAGVDLPLPAENEAVHGILLKILRKWRREMEEATGDLEETVPKETLPRSSQVKEETVSETVILSPEKVQEIARKMKESVLETVIVSSSDAAQRASRPAGAREKMRDRNKGEGPTAEEAEEGTVTAKKQEQPEDDSLSETIILSPEKLRDLEKKER